MKKSYTQTLEDLTKKIEEIESVQMHLITGLHVIIKEMPVSGLRRAWMDRTSKILEEKLKKIKGKENGKGAGKIK